MNQRLTQDQAQDIIRRVAEGETQKKLAAEYGVCPSTVSNLVSGRSWPNLERPQTPNTKIRGAKLKPEDIPVILVRLATEKSATIAADYGVTRQTIDNIKRGKTWAHIPRPQPTTRQRKKVWET